MKKLFILGLCIVSIHASACSVPVFRYALERWERDPYPVAILYRQTQPEIPFDVKEYLDKLQAGDVITSEMIDVSEKSRVTKQLMAAAGSTTLPALLVLYPPRNYKARSLAVVELKQLTLAQLTRIFQSKTRDIIAERLAAGESAVWVFLEWDDPNVNDERLKVLKESLKRLEKELAIPEQVDVVAEFRDEVEQLQIKFSVVTVPYDLSKDPGEAIFREILLNVEPDLKALKGPMTFPVFGQGRALYALIGRGINESNIGEACEFLTGPCSCQVKDLNPGMDLLFSANWSDKVESLIRLDDESPPLTGYSGFVPEPDEPSPEATPVPAAPQAAKRGGTLARPIFIGVGALITIMAVAGGAMLRKK